jgi:hypothetical protein
MSSVAEMHIAGVRQSWAIGGKGVRSPADRLAKGFEGD